ncbi:hypothetical protein [Loktanella sp. M215]|uniref:hypothetical protein n=1 Tax=Loktanella sp. M215 TaxID=2675431 RepID=UPI001F3B5D4A|nr:hypothetical protein [Loktanella sp. M215]MCF7699601.1 hypothetical protein [Loktanella sp. M215]
MAVGIADRATVHEAVHVLHLAGVTAAVGQCGIHHRQNSGASVARRREHSPCRGLRVGDRF